MAYDLESQSIAELRKLCSVMKIEAQKDWDKSAYINAINTRRKNTAVAQVVTDESQDIPEGFVRIRLPLTPSGTDTPLNVMVNNFKTSIPRNVIVDIPKEARDQIRNSKESMVREKMDKDGNKVLEVVEVQCYPFESLGEKGGTSGAVRPNGDAREQRLREKYRDLYGKWPKRSSEDWTSFRNAFLEKANSRVVNSEADAA